MKISSAVSRAVLIFMMTTGLWAQEGIGLPSLKIGVGARQAGMANVFTGVGDDVYTLYWNPGGLGHLRRWQWSLDYNRWFSDVYQASFSFAKQVRILGSRKTGIGITCSYLGMPSWDATGGVQDEVSANDLVASLSVGQRLDWIHPTLSIGIQAKVIQSHYDEYSATGTAADAGILFRSPRFKLGTPFKYGMITAGLALSNHGADMTFISEKTVLPRTYRGGLSFMMGTYRAWQILIASDWSQVIGSESQWALGTEVCWMDLLSARAGYRWNRLDLGDFSVGIGFRWDNVMNGLLNLPSRFGDAFALDLAAVDYGQILQQTYRGAVSHYPLAPEPFRLDEPEELESQNIHTGWMKLVWEKAYDPDPFDEVNYLLIIDPIRSRVDQAIRLVEREYRSLWDSGLKDSLLIAQELSDTAYIMAVHPGDVFYWAVAAYDLSYHAQLAKRGKERIGTIVVPTADLAVTSLQFKPHPWITRTPEQGVLYYTVANKGDKPTPAFRCEVTDRYVHPKNLWPVDSLIEDLTVPGLKAGEEISFQIDWNTPYNGPHIIEMMVDADTVVSEFQKYNNIYEELVYSIPKGSLTVPDSVEVVTTDYDSTDIPIVAEVYFDANSSSLDSVYYAKSVGLPPILTILCTRLQENPDVRMRILGYLDITSGENAPELADSRAQEVWKELVRMGVSPAQLEISTDHPDKVIQADNRRRTQEDAEMVMEQNRVVRFETDREFEEVLFHPVSVAVDTSVKDRIPFKVNIISPGYVDRLFIGRSNIVVFESGDKPAYSDSVKIQVWWDGSDQNNRLVPRNRWYPYQLTLTDTLGRTFLTHPDSIFLREQRTIRKQEVFGAAKFAQIEPVYQFYWDRMLQLVQEMAEDRNLKLRFEGHACIIGPEEVNERLSKNRAQNFTQAFLDRVRQTYPDQYNNIRTRTELPKGYGESQPLIVMFKNQGQVILGDNKYPAGRYLNRRISILLLRKR
jgi:outer membrane protein OmpA-like peptidoglycan-associated protein